MALAIEDGRQKHKEAEEKIAGLEKDYDSALTDLVKARTDFHAMRAAADIKAKRAVRLESELAEREAELVANGTELEKALKEKSDLTAAHQVEADARYREGVADATKDYERQVEELGPYLFELGCKSTLKKAAVPDDHPVFKDLPKLEEHVVAQEPVSVPSTPLEEAAPGIPIPDPVSDDLLPPEVPTPDPASDDPLPPPGVEPS